MRKLLGKIKHNTLFGILIGVILCSGIVYGVNTYQSNTIEYSPTDSSWEVSNVSDAINSLHSMSKELETIKSIGNATATQILSGKKAVVKGSTITGTMIDRGAVTSTLNAGGSYTIPAGYHNGSGKVTANSLASQTLATATASDIAIGKTAWVNGTKLTGSVGAKSDFKHDTFNAPVYNETQTINIGFKPNALLVLNTTAYYTFKATYMDGVTYAYYVNGNTDFSSFITLTDNGFIFKCPPSTGAQGDYEFYAYKYNE